MRLLPWLVLPFGRDNLVKRPFDKVKNCCREIFRDFSDHFRHMNLYPSNSELTDCSLCM